MIETSTLRRCAFLTTLLTIIFTLTLSSNLPARDQGTGLILPTDEEYRSVPLASLPFSGTELQRQVDLSPEFPPPGNQGRQNSCVGWTLAYALKSYQERKEEGNRLRTITGKPDYNHVFSPAFLYNQLNHGRDGGVHIHLALRFLEEKGVCTWNDMPYNSKDYRSQPSGQAQINAKRYRINTWRRINTQSLKEMKTHLQAGYPLAVGALIDEGFARYNHPPGWIWRDKLGTDKGAHAILVVGYDDNRNAFKVINSWGRKWGENGYGWIDYTHFSQVVPVGYVTMDALNGSDQNDHSSNKVPLERKKRHVISPTPFTQGARVGISNIFHNANVPNRPDLGKFLRIDGWLQIPGGAGRTDQVVVHYYYQLANGQVGPRVVGNMAAYSDAYGYATCGTAVYPVPHQGLSTTFSAWIPYAAFGLPAGEWCEQGVYRRYQARRSNLVGIPTLYIDNFGVATGNPIYFYVDR